MAGDESRVFLTGSTEQDVERPLSALGENIVRWNRGKACSLGVSVGAVPHAADRHASLTALVAHVDQRMLASDGGRRRAATG